MRTWIAVAALVLVAAFTTACGSSSETESVGEFSWGETYPGVVEVKAGAPQEFTTADQANIPSERAWRSVITLKNNGAKPFDVAWMRVGAAAPGGDTQEVLDPWHGCNGMGAGQPLMQGQQVTMIGCWTGSGSPKSVTFTTLDNLQAVTFADAS